ncbi:citrate/2-methylcitrate synthase [Streptomyces sp. NPDC059740]|uniref:citrate/2-methylcitrate synthase n=1 Tax=Streptomyces sp. NPDC059740 TaxID=3346926 RepID=UPI00364F46EE
MTDPEHADAPRLTTQEAARRLGVKPETVYAYVSRGQLSSRRVPGGRGSTFDAREVDALAHRSAQREPARRSPELVFRTAVTLIEDDRCHLRGVDVTALARHRTFEEVACWLWTGEPHPGARLTSPATALRAARAAVAALPVGGGPVDRLQAAVTAAAAADPLRFDLSPGAVAGTARALLPVLVDALPAVAENAPPPDASAPLVERLWPKLTSLAPHAAGLRALQAAMVLLVDHDLAASTLAARVAASVRAHPYAVVSAALGALDGPLHGAASGSAHGMLVAVGERGAGEVVAEHLRSGRPVPGLGHRVYRGEDPRAVCLFALLADDPRAAAPLAAAREVVETASRDSGLHANVDLALAVLTVAYDMPATGGETLFALARTAGWIAHAVEEYRESPLRLRPAGRYEGPRPPQPLP